MKKNNIFASIISAKPLNNAHLGGFSILTYLILASCNPSKKLVNNDKSKDSIIYVDKIQIDTIKDTKIINQGFDMTFDFECDSAKINNVYSSGDIQYRVIKEKGAVKFIIKKDSTYITDKYKSVLRSKDSLQKVVNKSIESKVIVRKPPFADLWRIAFFIILVLWVFGITPKFIIKKFVSL